MIVPGPSRPAGHLSSARGLCGSRPAPGTKLRLALAGCGSLGALRALRVLGTLRRSRWHRGSSKAEDWEVALEEALAEWRQSFGAPRVSEAAVEAPVESQVWPDFSRIDDLWHSWRASGLGLKLSEAVERAGLKEAFKLFPDQGADVVYPKWRTALRWEKPDRPPADATWKMKKRQGAVAAALRECARELQEVAIAAPKCFLLASVPSRWAQHLEPLARRLERAIGWPETMPFIAVLTHGSLLSFGTAMLHEAQTPKAFFLGPREFEEVGAEGYRLQEQLDMANKYYTKYWQEHGRLNGTVVACRIMHQRSRNEVSSMLVFGDPAAEADFTRQGLGLLDSAYPQAVKLGLLTAAGVAGGSSMYLGGRFGGLKTGGLLGILLSNHADSAVGLCGCEPLGPFWEVFESDNSPRASVLKRVSDPKSPGPRDAEGRQVAQTLAQALSDLDVEVADLWVGIPRADLRTMRSEASSCGEFALYKARQLLATGSLLLDGPGPGAELVGGGGRLARPIARAQLFRNQEDTARLGQMFAAYSMERAAKKEKEQQPFVTLAFGGGDGPAGSFRDERLFGQLGLGLAVLGAPGNVLQESMDPKAETDNPQPIPHAATLIHRQAAGLLMLYP